MLIGAQKRSGFVATLLTLTAFGHAKARRDSLRESLNLHLIRRPVPEATYRVGNPAHAAGNQWVNNQWAATL